MDEQSPWTPWTVDLPPDFLEPVLVDLTTLAVEKQNLVTRSTQDGQFYRVEWHQIEHMRRWAPITDRTAQQLCEPVRKYRNLTHWLDLFGEPAPKEEGCEWSGPRSRKEWARLWKCSKETVDRKKQGLRTRKIGNKFVFDRNDLRKAGLPEK